MLPQVVGFASPFIGAALRDGPAAQVDIAQAVLRTSNAVTPIFLGAAAIGVLRLTRPILPGAMPTSPRFGASLAFSAGLYFILEWTLGLWHFVGGRGAVPPSALEVALNAAEAFTLLGVSLVVRQIAWLRGSTRTHKAASAAILWVFAAILAQWLSVVGDLNPVVSFIAIAAAGLKWLAIFRMLWSIRHLEPLAPAPAKAADDPPRLASDVS